MKCFMNLYTLISIRPKLCKIWANGRNSGELIVKIKTNLSTLDFAHLIWSVNFAKKLFTLEIAHCTTALRQQDSKIYIRKYRKNIGL